MERENSLEGEGKREGMRLTTRISSKDSAHSELTARVAHYAISADPRLNPMLRVIPGARGRFHARSPRSLTNRYTRARGHTVRLRQGGRRRSHGGEGKRNQRASVGRGANNMAWRGNVADESPSCMSDSLIRTA